MSDGDSVAQTFNDIREWNECGARLNAILEEFRNRRAKLLSMLMTMGNSLYILMFLKD
jgi:hypothetical protein